MGINNMTIKELKAIIRKLDKNTVVKVNGKDAKVEISVNQDGQWSINFMIMENSTTPAALEADEKIERWFDVWRSALDGERLAH